MRLNAEYSFPDDSDDDESQVPLEFPDKYKVVATLDDILGDEKEELEELKTKVRTILDHEQKERPDHSALVSYIAFQSMQIHSLQKEIQSLHKIALVLAQSIDERCDNKPEWVVQKNTMN